MHFVRCETYCGGYITQENGRPPASFRAQLRQSRKAWKKKMNSGASSRYEYKYSCGQDHYTNQYLCWRRGNDDKVIKRFKW